MSQKQAIEFLKGHESVEYIYATLVDITYAGQQGCLGYVMYRQLDKKEYAKTLARITTNAE
eukprot:5960041-Heterocapsa_arctica.AAC.1